MTDCELLELAARASGYNVRWHERWECFVHADPHNIDNPPTMAGQRHVWSPLTDDGDALRLAADLGLVICTDKRGVCAQTIPGITPSAYASQGGPDHMANICRAITRAAAEIGRAMP